MSADDTTPHAVRLDPALTTTGTAVRGLGAVGGWFAVGFGGLMVVWSALAFFGAIRDGRNDTSMTVTAVVVLVVFLGLTAVGVWMIRNHRDGTRRLLSARHAFVITDETLEFPELPGEPAQSWPLERTRTSSMAGRRGKLTLECPDFRSRAYLQAYLAEPVEDVQRRIMAAQRRLASGAD